LPVAAEERRTHRSGVVENRAAGKFSTFEELEEGAPCRRDISDSGRDPRPVDRRDGVSAPHHRKRAGLADGLGHTERSCRESLGFEDPHRSVPDNGLCDTEGRPELRDGRGPDVEPHPIGWYLSHSYRPEA